MATFALKPYDFEWLLQKFLTNLEVFISRSALGKSLYMDCGLIAFYTPVVWPTCLVKKIGINLWPQGEKMNHFDQMHSKTQIPI